MKHKPTRFPIAALLAGLFATTSAISADWDSHGGNGGCQYTELERITSENFQNLEVAWRFQTGDLNQGFARKGHFFKTNPMFWEGALFDPQKRPHILAFQLLELDLA